MPSLCLSRMTLKRHLSLASAWSLSALPLPCALCGRTAPSLTHWLHALAVRPISSPLPSSSMWFMQFKNPSHGTVSSNQSPGYKEGGGAGRFIIRTERLLSTLREMIGGRKSFLNNIHYLTVINNRKLAQQMGMLNK